jgi:hypothetical protein
MCAQLAALDCLLHTALPDCDADVIIALMTACVCVCAAVSTCLEVVSAPADGLRMYNRRCPRPFYQVLETPTGTLPNGTLVLW